MRILNFGVLSLIFASVSFGANSKVVHVDRAHGQFPLKAEMNALAENLDLELRPSEMPLTTALLEDVTLLYLRAPNQAFGPEERQVIIDFVKSGGALFLVIDEESRQQLAVTFVNDIISPFGLMLTGDTTYLHNCGAIGVEGVINKARREIPYSGGRAVAGGTAFAFRLGEDGEPDLPFAAYQEVTGGGRVVVMGEGMVTLFMGEKNVPRLEGVTRNPGETIYWGGDSTLFMEEVFAWLVKQQAIQTSDLL